MTSRGVRGLQAWVVALFLLIIGMLCAMCAGCSCTLSDQEQREVAVWSSHHKVWDARVHSWDT